MISVSGVRAPVGAQSQSPTAAKAVGLFHTRQQSSPSQKCILNVYLIAIRITRIKEKPRRSGADVALRLVFGINGDYQRAVAPVPCSVEAVPVAILGFGIIFACVDAFIHRIRHMSLLCHAR